MKNIHLSAVFVFLFIFIKTFVLGFDVIKGCNLVDLNYIYYLSLFILNKVGIFLSAKSLIIFIKL
jgi:hypothetical protein